MIFQNSQEGTRPQFGQPLFEHTAPVKSSGRAARKALKLYCPNGKRNPAGRLSVFPPIGKGE
jgi:hypothetical protein